LKLSVEDVTDKAEINRATFYKCFVEKYALLDYTIKELFKKEIEKRTLDACHYIWANLWNLSLAVCEFLCRRHRNCAPPRQQFESLGEGTIKNQISELLSYWLEPSKSRIPQRLPRPWPPGQFMDWHLFTATAHLPSGRRQRERPALEKFVEEALPQVVVNFEQFAQPP